MNSSTNKTEKSVLLNPVNNNYLQYRRWIRLLGCWAFISLFANFIQLVQYIKISDKSDHHDSSHNNYAGSVNILACFTAQGSIFTLIIVGFQMCHHSFVEPPNEEAQKNFNVSSFEFASFEFTAGVAFVLNLVFGSMIAYDVTHNY